jgi:hypothetical protein
MIKAYMIKGQCKQEKHMAKLKYFVAAKKLHSQGGYKVGVVYNEPCYSHDNGHLWQVVRAGQTAHIAQDRVGENFSWAYAQPYNG